MAKIYGSNRVIGTVGKVRHYILPGVEGIVAAECGGQLQKQIKNNPAFARTRENMEEWKGAVLMGKKVWEGLGVSARPIINRFLIGKLNKAMLKVLRSDLIGLRGVRSIFLSEHKNMLDYLQYWYYKPFRDIMKCRFEVDTGPDRRSVTVRLINLTPTDQVSPPAEATHFQFFLSVGVVCDHLHSQKARMAMNLFMITTGCNSEPMNLKVNGSLSMRKQWVIKRLLQRFRIILCWPMT